MTDTAESLDPLRLPLQGERLIEASAGTGKTFTIAALYLRLLLGLGGNAAFPRPLSVEELLVVTFTEAATAELRGRIRTNIHELRIACLRQSTDNPLYASLLEEIADKQQAAHWLLLAERQMDEASVFTIHGFCQRMLSLNAFESGMLFEQQLIEDESLLRYQACADFWRRHCYPLPRDIAQVIFETWKGPQALLADINRYLQGEAPVIKAPPPDDETLASRHQQIVQRINALKQQWCEAVDELDLGNGEGRSRTRHDILHAALAQTDHVGLAFHEQGLALLAHGALRQVDTIEFVGLVVDLGVGRVDILHAHAMGAGVEDAARETQIGRAHV